MQSLGPVKTALIETPHLVISYVYATELKLDPSITTPRILSSQIGRFEKQVLWEKYPNANYQTQLKEFCFSTTRCQGVSTRLLLIRVKNSPFWSIIKRALSLRMLKEDPI